MQSRKVHNIKLLFSQSMIPPYGAPYAAFYAHGGVYAHPGVPLVSDTHIWLKLVFIIIISSFFKLHLNSVCKH